MWVLLDSLVFTFFNIILHFLKLCRLYFNKYNPRKTFILDIFLPFYAFPTYNDILASGILICYHIQCSSNINWCIWVQIMKQQQRILYNKYYNSKRKLQDTYSQYPIRETLRNVTTKKSELMQNLLKLVKNVVQNSCCFQLSSFSVNSPKKKNIIKLLHFIH